MASLVKIISCSEENLWYSHKIGDYLIVDGEGKHARGSKDILKELYTGFGVLKKDTKLIREKIKVRHYSVIDKKAHNWVEYLKAEKEKELEKPQSEIASMRS